MIVGTLTVDLSIRQARSLKDKRRVVQSLKERIRARFAVAIAEVDHLDNPQRAQLGIAVVGTDRRVLESVLGRVERYAARDSEALLTQCETDFLWG